MLAPLGARGGLGATLAAEAEERALEAAMRLPDSAWRRMDRLDRARARAVLRRITTSAHERDKLVADADAYAAHASSAALAVGEPVPFLFAVGPVGGESVFRLPARDVQRFATAAPGSWAHFEGALLAWPSAPPAVRCELVGALVAVSTALGTAAAARRLPTNEEIEEARALHAALTGKEPAAATDAEVASALCRAYVAGISRTGEEATFEPVRETR